jgi:hypothetical protein
MYFSKVLRSVVYNKYGRPSQYSIFSLIDDDGDGEEHSYISILKDLLANKVNII